jgi:hypothetical protein
VSQPLVIAHHLIWTIYGTWLPNDPRGSGSQTVATDAIAELGEVHYGRRQVQPAGWVIREFYERAHEILRFPVLTFDSEDRLAIAEAIRNAIAEQCYTCYACAVMPDHLHILIRKHKHQAEQMIAVLQGNASDNPGAGPARSRPSGLDEGRLEGIPRSSRRGAADDSLY